jgi:hypothetical protein
MGQLMIGADDWWFSEMFFFYTISPLPPPENSFSSLPATVDNAQCCLFRLVFSSSYFEIFASFTDPPNCGLSNNVVSYIFIRKSNKNRCSLSIAINCIHEAKLE